ncbi:YlbF family regulator [Paenibacillus pinihumi]|uniref:YlbF family regulator n=1 Tax=Paenibacillus pinihumi TaxID=669462 RepID=UPI0003FFA072|nr:YlbF family regulator [Paenibacillus pinihumi]
MNVYDKAYELAKALRESLEVQDLKAARQVVESDSEAKRMLDDFRSRQEGFQQKMMAGEEPSEGDLDTMNRLYEVISLNPHIHRLFEAERRFAAVFDDVNKIMSDALKDIYE